MQSYLNIIFAEPETPLEQISQEMLSDSFFSSRFSKKSEAEDAIRELNGYTMQGKNLSAHLL